MPFLRLDKIEQYKKVIKISIYTICLLILVLYQTFILMTSSFLSMGSRTIYTNFDLHTKISFYLLLLSDLIFLSYIILYNKSFKVFQKSNLMQRIISQKRYFLPTVIGINIIVTLILLIRLFYLLKKQSIGILII